MADVEMTDAAPKAKVAKAAAGEVDGKKRFEIKKVDLMLSATSEKCCKCC